MSSIRSSLLPSILLLFTGLLLLGCSADGGGETGAAAETPAAEEEPIASESFEEGEAVLQSGQEGDTADEDGGTVESDDEASEEGGDA